jgi:hypothetical protein
MTTEAHPTDLLTTAPADDYALLELEVDWPDLAAAERRIADALRLFVITRDPLDWVPNRGYAWATANADGDSLELPVYVSRGVLLRELDASGGDLGDAVRPFIEPVLLTGGRCEGILFAGAYPDLASRRQAPRLLEAPAGADRLRTPTVRLRSPGWEPMGLGAVQDLVQDAFGPVDLDRSKVALEPVPSPRAECPACAGARFGFPRELEEARGEMCSPHRAHALALTSARFARAQRSNPTGWRAIAKGSARVSDSSDPPEAPMPQRHAESPGRNAPCPCGSGRKYKHCCGALRGRSDWQRRSEDRAAS